MSYQKGSIRSVSGGTVPGVVLVLSALYQRVVALSLFSVLCHIKVSIGSGSVSQEPSQFGDLDLTTYHP